VFVEGGMQECCQTCSTTVKYLRHTIQKCKSENGRQHWKIVAAGSSGTPIIFFTKRHHIPAHNFLRNI